MGLDVSAVAVLLVLAAEPTPEATAQPDAAPPPQAVWSGTATLSTIWLTGNSESFAISGGAKAERRTATWIYALAFAGNYGEARGTAPGASTEVVALNATARARADRRLTEMYAVYLLAGVDTDHVKSIEARPYGEAGLSVTWLDELDGDFSRLRLITDAAFRAGNEYRFQYYPTPANVNDFALAAPKLGLKFRYAPSRDVVFEEEAEALYSLIDTRWLAVSTTRLSLRLVEPLSIGVAYQVRYESVPPPGKKSTDTSLTVGLELAF